MAIITMDQFAKKVLPIGFNYEWSVLSLEEIARVVSRWHCSALVLLMVYLTLSAQYESFVLPSSSC